MSQGLLVFILSVLTFVLGAVFINYTVKRDEAKEAKEAQVQAQATTKASEMKKAA
ncbi:MAG: hypothetical protein J6D25_03840 [Eggerthellaceae bacterium]|nr:hypothetical protein [Eggerthellaceae bacterium]